MTDAITPPLSEGYRQARLRLTALLHGLDPAATVRLVPTCPAWSVHDVVAHLVAIPTDAMAGRLAGPPSDEQTAEQVARFADRDIHEMLQAWTEVAPDFESAIDAMDIWPAVLDVLAHEQDIRGAVGQAGARDTVALRAGAERLVALLDPPVPLRVVMGPTEVVCGPSDGAEIVLRTDHYEAFRWRLGRRSQSQMARLDWSSDPGELLDHLVMFGPAATDIIE